MACKARRRIVPLQCNTDTESARVSIRRCDRGCALHKAEGMACGGVRLRGVEHLRGFTTLRPSVYAAKVRAWGERSIHAVVALLPHSVITARNSRCAAPLSTPLWPFRLLSMALPCGLGSLHSAPPLAQMPVLTSPRLRPRPACLSRLKTPCPSPEAPRAPERASFVSPGSGPMWRQAWHRHRVAWGQTAPGIASPKPEHPFDPCQHGDL